MVNQWKAEKPVSGVTIRKELIPSVSYPQCLDPQIGQILEDKARWKPSAVDIFSKLIWEKSAQWKYGNVENVKKLFP